MKEAIFEEMLSLLDRRLLQKGNDLTLRVEIESLLMRGKQYIEKEQLKKYYAQYHAILRKYGIEKEEIRT